MNGIKRKVDLYVLSLSLLFLFFIIVTVDVPFCIGYHCSFVGWESVLTLNNTVAFISFILFLYGVIAYFSFRYELQGSTEIPFKITKVKSINYEHLTFLATYLIPLISFDFDDSRQMIVLFLLLFFMGIIYIKTDLFYANPSLALLGFHIYECDGRFKNGERQNIILVSRELLSEDDDVAYIKLDERIYYVSTQRKLDGKS